MNAFLERFRTKTREVETEAERLTDAAVRAEAEAGTSERVRRCRDELAVEVDALRARLADGNVALDAMSSGDVVRARADLDARAREARARSADAKAAAAAAEAARTQALAEASRLESQCDERAHAVAAKMALLPPSARYEFEALERERTRLEERRECLERSLEEVAEATAELERGIAADPRKRRALALRESLASLEAKRSALAEARAVVSLSPEEQRARLETQIRSDTATTEHAKAETAALCEAARTAEARLAEARLATAVARDGGSDAELDEAPVAFADAFESNAARAAEKQEASRHENHTSLAETSKGLKDEVASSKPASPASLRPPSDPAEAEATEARIADELRALAERSAKMRNELASFGDAEENRENDGAVWGEINSMVAELNGLMKSRAAAA